MCVSAGQVDYAKKMDGDLLQQDGFLTSDVGIGFDSGTDAMITPAKLEAAKKAGLCSGDFVRAEAIRANEWVAGAAPNFPVKRDDALASAAEAVRVQTTRRSQWQHRA